MSDDTPSSILEHSRGMRNDLMAFRTQTESDFRDVRARLTQLELGVAAIKRDQSHTFDEAARQQAGIDRLADRAARIENRLELIP